MHRGMEEEMGISIRDDRMERHGDDMETGMRAGLTGFSDWDIPSISKL